MINLFISLQPSSFTKIDATINYLIAIIDFIKDLYLNNILLEDISEFLKPLELIKILEINILQLINNGNVSAKFLEKQPLFEKLILFIISLPKYEYDLIKSRLFNILTQLYKVPLLFRLFTNKEDIMNNLFHKLILEDKREIFYHFLGVLYPLTIYDLDNEYRRRMLKSIKNYFSSKIESNNDDNEYDVQCVIKHFLSKIYNLI